MTIDDSEVAFLRPNSKPLTEDCQTEVVGERILVAVLLARLRSPHGSHLCPACLSLLALLDFPAPGNLLYLECNVDVTVCAHPEGHSLLLPPHFPCSHHRLVASVDFKVIALISWARMYFRNQ